LSEQQGHQSLAITYIAVQSSQKQKESWKIIPEDLWEFNRSSKTLWEFKNQRKQLSDDLPPPPPKKRKSPEGHITENYGH